MEKFQAVPKILNMFYQDGQGDFHWLYSLKKKMEKKILKALFNHYCFKTNHMSGKNVGN